MDTDEALMDKKRRLQEELEELTARYRNKNEAGVLQRMNAVKTGLARTDRELIERAMSNPNSLEAGTPPPVKQSTGTSGNTRDVGLRAIETIERHLSPEAGDRLDDLVRRDEAGLDSRYLAAVSDPAYERAFAKRIADPVNANYKYSPEEAEAVRVAEQIGHERALAVGTGNLGGFAVPATLDPSVILTSDGQVNPIRELATVTTIATDTWQGVSSDGVDASWYDEAEEVSDDSPTFSQPEITPQRMSVFIPFSIELGQDWTGLTTELGKLFADAKDNLEASAFIGGTATNSPQGLHTGGTHVGGTALTPDGVYACQAALPPRYQANASWLSSNAIQNTTYRLVASADADEPALVGPDRMSILGKPWYEASAMPVTTSGTVVSYGDISKAYRLVDRIGSSLELVSHLFNGNQRPTGQRGAFFYTRVGGGVVDPNAVRSIVV